MFYVEWRDVFIMVVDVQYLWVLDTSVLLLLMSMPNNIVFLLSVTFNHILRQ